MEHNTVLNEHPVYKQTLPIASGHGNVSGKYLYLYFLSYNQSWAISHELGSQSVVAYVHSTATSATELTGLVWNVTAASGDFVDDTSIACGKLIHSRLTQVLVLVRKIYVSSFLAACKDVLSPYRHSLKKQQHLSFFLITPTDEELNDICFELASPGCRILSLK
jgi:hypothetical protein